MLVFLGTFCHDLLNNAARWHEKGLTTLPEIVRVVVEHIDNPNPDYAVSYGKSLLDRDIWC